MSWRNTTKSKKRLRLSVKRKKRVSPTVLAAKRQREQQQQQTAQPQAVTDPSPAEPSTSTSTSAPAHAASSAPVTNTSQSMEEFVPNDTSTPRTIRRKSSIRPRKRAVPIQLMKWRLAKKIRTESVSMSSTSINTSTSTVSDCSTLEINITSHQAETDVTTKDTCSSMPEPDVAHGAVSTEYSRPSVDMNCNSSHTETAREYNELTIESDGRPPKDNLDMLSGRYIVDGKHFIQEIRSLDYHRYDCQKSDKGYMGLVSSNQKALELTLKYMCPYCKMTKVISSEPQEHVPRATDWRSPTSKLSLVDQAVWGFSSIGSGHRNMEEVLASVNVAPISEKTFRKSEERLGQVWQEKLFESMIEAGIEEKKLATEKGDVTKNNVPFISVIVDGGWSHRSHGHRYSANSGVACVIGLRTKKLLHLDVRNKYCSMCTHLEKKDLPTTHSNCFKNWDGASSSMESDMIVDAFNASENIHGLQYRKMVGDGDSSVHHKIRELVSYGRHVEKIECTNHMIKNYTKRLFKIRESGNVESRILNLTTIKRLKAAVRGAIIQHSTDKNIEELKKDMKNSPFHVLGCHLACKSYFCQKVGTGEALEGQTLVVSNKILEALKPLVLRASSIWENLTSNLAENYMSLVAKFTGGKQINRGKRGSFTFRTRAAALDFQYGPMWQYRTMKSVMKRSPALLVKNTGLRRLKRVVSCRKSLLKRSSVKANNPFKSVNKSKSGNEDYGTNCKKLDLDDKEFEEEKRDILKSLALTTAEKIKIEIKTRGQRENPHWLEERKSRLTASNFGTVCKRLPKSKWAPVVKSQLYSSVSTSAMLYGELNESSAIASFEALTEKKVIPCGLFIDDEYDFLAASPDGLVGEDAIIEIKCPKSAENDTIDEAIKKFKNFYLTTEKSSGNVSLKSNHNYYYQVQGQLHIAKKRRCYFVVWTKKDIHIEQIEADQKFWKEKMERKLVYFYNYVLLPEIADPRTCRNLPIREPAVTFTEFVRKFTN